MNKFARKFLSGMVAATLVLSSSMVAFAAEPDTGTASGDGSFEGYVDKSVYQVVLPTVPQDDATYDYILDPAGLIAKTSAEKYGGASAADFETGKSLYFYNKEENSKKVYTDKSNFKYVGNLGTEKVDVTVTATATASEDIEFSNTATFTEADKEASIYLALTDGASSDPQVSAVNATTGAKLTFQLAAAAEGAYEIALKDLNTVPTESDKTDDTYVWAMTTAATTEAGTFSAAIAANDMSTYTTSPASFSYAGFQMTGAANTYGDWSAFGDEAPTSPTVTVTWTLKQHVDEAAPSVTSTEVEMVNGQQAVINVDLGVGSLAATGIKSVTWNGSDWYAAGSASFADNKITVQSANIDYLISKGQDVTVIVTFNDSANEGAGTSVEVTFKVPTA